MSPKGEPPLHRRTTGRQGFRSRKTGGPNGPRRHRAPTAAAIRCFIASFCQRRSVPSRRAARRDADGMICQSGRRVATTAGVRHLPRPGSGRTLQEFR